MTRGRWLILAALLGAAPGVTQAQQASPELQALDDALPGTLINDPSRLDWQVYGKGQKTRSVRSADIPGGGAAVQVSIAKAGSVAHEIGANIPLTAGIASGSDVVAAFYARTVNADTPDGKGRIGLRFQQNAAPYPGFGDKVLEIDGEWRLYEVAAHADRSIGKDQAFVSLQLAGAKQVIEIGQMIVVEGAKSLQAVAARPAAVPAAAGALPLQLAGKGQLLNDPAKRDWGVFGAGEKHEAVKAGIPGGVATRFTIASAGAKPYDVGVSIPIGEAIRTDDVITVAFTARTIAAETADSRGVLGIRIQRNAAPWPGFGDNQVSVGPNWQLLQLRTQADFDIEKGAGSVTLHLAGAAQTIEIGSIYVLGSTPE